MSRPLAWKTWYDKFGRIIDFLRWRKRAYQRTFGGPEDVFVLADLARFCRASDTCFHSDARLHAVLEGRREVWLRIQNHLMLSPEKLLEIYDKGRPPPITEDEG